MRELNAWENRGKIEDSIKYINHTLDTVVVCVRQARVCSVICGMIFGTHRCMLMYLQVNEQIKISHSTISCLVMDLLNVQAYLGEKNETKSASTLPKMQSVIFKQ